MNKYIEVDQDVLEKLLSELKGAKLALMYEFTGDFYRDRPAVQAKIDEYRASLGLPPDPKPITNDD